MNKPTYHHQDDTLSHREKEHCQKENAVVLKQLLWRSCGVERRHRHANERSDDGREYTGVLWERENERGGEGRGERRRGESVNRRKLQHFCVAVRKLK